MQNKEDIIPIGGLNTDDDPRHFTQGDYEEMRNLFSGPTQEQGDEGLVSSVRSTASYAFPTIEGETPTNTTQLGVAEDEENDRAYILGYAETASGTNKWFVIFKHNILDNTIKIVFLAEASDWNMKAWDADMQKCYNPRIVDGRLIFTDNVNDIRQMDVVKMETTRDAGIDKVVTMWNRTYGRETGYAAGDFVYYLDKVYVVLQSTLGFNLDPAWFLSVDYYTSIANVVDVYLDPIDPNNFTLAALPPLISPLAEYVPLSGINVNQLKGKTWQFSYQYIYMDYRKSTFVSPSIVPPPSQEENIDGSPEIDPTHNNAIRLSINTGNEQVRSIRIVGRTSEDTSTWFVIDDVYMVNDKGYRVQAAEENIYVYFTNDKSGEVVESATVFNLFHYVPIRAKHMELIEGNRLAFGNITEGYPRIGSLVDIEIGWEDLAGITTQNMMLNVLETSQQVSGDNFDFLLRFTLPTLNPGPCLFTMVLNTDLDSSGAIYLTYNYNGTDSYPSAVVTGCQNAIDAAYSGEVDTCFIPSAYAFCAFPRNGSIYSRPMASWTYSFYYVKSSITAIDKVRQLKTGATHAWAMIYRDLAGRVTPLVGAEEMTKYIPFPTESTSSNVGRRPLITFSIKHLPPPQAESYEIVYAGNKSTSWHLQLLGYNFSYGKKNHADSSTFEQWDEYFRLRVYKAQTNTSSNLLNWSVEQYSWEKGDRIRIIGKVSVNGILTEINDSIYDVEIMAIYDDYEEAQDIGDDPQDDTEVIHQWIYFPVNSNLPLFIPEEGEAPNLYPDNLFVEIYRPFTTESNLYFTTGMTFPVKTDIYGNKIHGGDVDQILDSNGVTITPATVQNTSHDNWKYLRNFRDVYDGQNFALWSESEYVSDFYLTSILTSQGNPVPDVASQQQNVLTKRIRHGGKVNIGSQINLIADFEYDDYEDMKDAYGPIEGMRIVGFVLKVIQYTKVVSVYISRLESYSASGESEYLFTDEIFGSVRPAMEDWGTRHPDSVMVYNRHLYFWEQSEGIVVRDAANGPESISDNKMRRYFIDKANTLKAYADQHNVWVQFGFSVATDELFCLFGTGSTAEIITFHEKSGRWKHQFDVSFERGLMYWFGRRLFQTTPTLIHEWWAGSNYNSLTGNTVAPKMVIYAIASPAKMHIYNAIHVYLTGGRPYFLGLTIPEKATSVVGEMETNIYDVNISEKEGVFYCEILKDINTPGTETQSHKEMNGREMRGLYLRIEMQVQNALDLFGKVTISNLTVVSTPSERSK